MSSQLSSTSHAERGNSVWDSEADSALSIHLRLARLRTPEKGKGPLEVVGTYTMNDTVLGNHPPELCFATQYNPDKHAAFEEFEVDPSKRMTVMEDIYTALKNATSKFLRERAKVQRDLTSLGRQYSGYDYLVSVAGPRLAAEVTRASRQHSLKKSLKRSESHLDRYSAALLNLYSQAREIWQGYIDADSSRSPAGTTEETSHADPPPSSQKSTEAEAQKRRDSLLADILHLELQTLLAGNPGDRNPGDKAELQNLWWNKLGTLSTIPTNAKRSKQLKEVTAPEAESTTPYSLPALSFEKRHWGKQLGFFRMPREHQRPSLLGNVLKNFPTSSSSTVLQGDPWSLDNQRTNFTASKKLLDAIVKGVNRLDEVLVGDHMHETQDGTDEDAENREHHIKRVDSLASARGERDKLSKVFKMWKRWKAERHFDPDGLRTQFITRSTRSRHDLPADNHPHFWKIAKSEEWRSALKAVAQAHQCGDNPLPYTTFLGEMEEYLEEDFRDETPITRRGTRQSAERASRLKAARMQLSKQEESRRRLRHDAWKSLQTVGIQKWPRTTEELLSMWHAAPPWRVKKNTGVTGTEPEAGKQ